ncbi:MAG TPA: sulfate ABC transporter substrate-binding protein [Candidatus Binatia bacterium]|nr:sulfate ABC transporter substrate-binding protein [Candidatus Binatia bacterium]
MLQRISLLFAAAALPLAAHAGSVTLLNVSYDPTRELYREVNQAFAAQWKAKTGDDVTINQSHGGSSKQARSIIDGLEADVATLGLAGDVDALYDKARLVPRDWIKRLPANATPYSSTVLFVVRKGNPKGIHDWGDLVKPGVTIATPNPKTSGNGKWSYLAAWAWAIREYKGDEARAREYIGKLYRNVPVLDTGARGTTVTFSQRGIGDVHLAWEDEALLEVNQLGPDKFQIVVPSVSVLAEPAVTVVDKYADKHGTRKVAQAYLEFLYTDAGQDIIARHGYRPRNPAVAAKYASKFPKVDRVPVEDAIFGGWSAVTAKHFADGGVFDQVFQK